jgi:hypothetical protein
MTVANTVWLVLVVADGIVLSVLTTRTLRLS